MRLAVRTTRQAISPRLAMSIFENMIFALSQLLPDEKRQAGIGLPVAVAALRMS
jgi:hypothetical protein